MLPTLNGRIQTRLFVILVIGGLWALLIGPLLPGDGEAADKYRTMYAVLVIVAVLGVGWEVVYHGLQQFRWEKDWPTLFGFLTGINEGLVVWYLVVPFGVTTVTVPTSTFVVHFATTWTVTWLWANGPMRVFFIRWRFNGGRLV